MSPTPPTPPLPPAVEPRLIDLPGHWLRLDASGHVLAASSHLLARLGPARQAAGENFLSWLSPASQALWSTSLWPTLSALHSLNEALLDLRLPPTIEPASPAAPAAPDNGEAADRVHTTDAADADPEREAAWPVLSSWRVELQAGAAPSFVGLLTPGLERRRLLSELRQARASLESMPGAVVQVASGPGGRLAFPYASSQLLDLFGVTPAQALARPERLLSALTPASRQVLEAAVAQAVASHAEQWLVVLTPAHRPHWRLQLAARRQGRPALWHGVVTDVSEREALQQELRVRAETDALTHLPNRSALMEQLRQRLASGQPLALLFMDCDRFKQINDSLGHEAGDEVLRHLAQRLRHGLRPADTLVSVGALEVGLGAGPGVDTQTDADADADADVVTDAGPMAARLGGDEFVVIADGVADAAGVAAIADRVVRAMAQPYRLRGLELTAPVSVGVVLARPDSAPEQMLRDADTAMYEAKRRGRGGWVLFEPEMHARVASALALESDLRLALQASEVRPAFQPIVEIASGRVVGLEALARWHHPLRGEVSPGQFIPVAEESGLIAELGEAVLRQACTAFAAWRRAGLCQQVRLSVNLSRAQLTDRTLPARVQALLAGLGLPSSALQLEVTESLAMDNDSAREVLAELRALEVQLALDDFGTGHSSLASLQHFPVQQVKIDRAFVQEIETSPYHRALVQAALQVAQALGLEAVAEGVETAAQVRLLAALGCARAQGWLYARALEASAVPAFLCGALPRYLDGHPSGRAPFAATAGAAPTRYVIVTDAQGRTVHVNAAFTLNTGYSLQELRGRTPGSLLQGPATDVHAARVLRDAQLNGTGCTGVEIVNYRKDGRPFTAVIDIEPVRDLQGRIVEFISLQTEVGAEQRV